APTMSPPSSLTTRLKAILAPFPFFMACACWPSPSSGASFTAKYDGQIQAATKRWWPDVPYWKLWKAQMIQESRLDPTAVSSVGARGLAQFMPSTWREVAAELGI